MTTPPTPDAGVLDAVLKEFGTVLCPDGTECKDFDCIAERLMAAEIIRLRAQLAAANADGAMLADSVEDFIGAQGTAYETDQYLMLQGVLREYHARTGAR